MFPVEQCESREVVVPWNCKWNGCKEQGECVHVFHKAHTVIVNAGGGFTGYTLKKLVSMLDQHISTRQMGLPNTNTSNAIPISASPL